ncbi:MAG TPA: 3-deoxy-7-phosphoheptulonate synthase, partial [Planctomycetota bacterium]|nr:3-deoxy-7-phosphoheptulonate synthase [Planctomycetota bacterium]
SSKDYRKQLEVATDVAKQIAGDSSAMFGLMLKSHLVNGRQNLKPGCPLTYNQSITDACLG